jgi:hypothetical protein
MNMTQVEEPIFEVLRTISKLTRTPEQEDEGRERLIRFLDTYNEHTAELPIVDSLCARFGLYPYMSTSLTNAGVCEALAVEYHTPAPLEEEGFTFHAEQQRIYEKLMDGESLILSAPTSFGKSVIVDALIASEKWSNLVLLVPTIALIDETRRRLVRFRSTYKMVTHPAESFAERNIIVMTQERFLEIEELPRVDFFMIDEFYKLSAGGRNDARRTLLNLAWNRLKSTGAQYYLIGPNIDVLDERLPEELHERLVRTDFKTVAVDIWDRSEVEDQRDDLKRLVTEELEDSTLVFTGSPQKAEDLGLLLASSATAHGLASEVAEWMARNYDESWDVVTALRGGVAVHTGPLPRGLQRIMVRLFNDSLVKTLVCTSTLIEGVNTAARNVVIFEKRIDSQLIDFFTFSNIRGRAGRMFRHFVGRVITYMEPPEADETSVDIPIETQSSLASDAALVQLDPEELDPEARERLSEIFEQNDLSLSTIRRNRGLDPTRQVETARRLRELNATDLARLSWTGMPTTDEARAALRFAFDHLTESHQRRGINFNMMWGQLQNVRHNPDDFQAQVEQQMRYARPGQTRSDVIADVLRFQRNWMGFTIPSLLRGLQTIQSEVASLQGAPAGNYEFLLREVENLYQPNGLVELEEYGLPLPLGKKLVSLGLTGDDVAEKLDAITRLGREPRVLSQLDVVEQWILEDVVAGLVGTRPSRG